MNKETPVTVDAPPYPGETWRWPTDCEQCGGMIGPWNPDRVGSPMTHIVAGGGPDWSANRDHDPVSSLTKGNGGLGDVPDR